MNPMEAAYLLNATLLILHEIESAYREEWKILKLPGGISGFLIMHVPVLGLVFWGLIEVVKGSTTGGMISVLIGTGGLAPFLVHKIFVRRPGYFDGFLSNVLIYSNIVSGLICLTLAIRFLARFPSG
jgi:hypothetical protein